MVAFLGIQVMSHVVPLLSPNLRQTAVWFGTCNFILGDVGKSPQLHNSVGNSATIERFKAEQSLGKWFF